MRLNLVRSAAPLALPALAIAFSALAGCSGSGSSSTVNQTVPSRYAKANLVSDVAGVATTTDPNLVNPWGIAFSPTGPFWIADNNSGKSTLYNGAGAVQSLVVTIPAPTAPTGGTATGQVFNGTTDFNLPNGSPALFIFATEDGTIVGWNGASGTAAVVVADRSAFPVAGSGAVYKGLAIGSNPSGNFLYATNFRAGTVDVFDKNYGLVLLSGSFADPSMPSGFAPFGIQNVGGDLVVTYARQDAAKHDDVSAQGSGIIDVFDSSGNLKRRLVTGSTAGGALTSVNSPWGVALAPSNFGSLSGALLVGNFGDGHINAFNFTTGAFIGQLQDNTGAAPVTIPGLWGLTFGNGGSAGATNTLFFTAGIGSPPTFTGNLEQHGLFGSLTVM